MFSKSTEKGYKNLLEGVSFKTLVYGERTLLSEFRIEQGSTIPAHRHPHEQTGYLISGRMKFLIAKEEIIAEAGDSWCIPGDVEHGVETLEDCLVVEVFSPVRKEYLP